MKLWFPTRRILRFLKRTFREAFSWALTLIVFLPPSVLLLILLKRTSDGSLKILEQLILIFLGSALLVGIREIQEKETRRNSTLKKQFKICSNFKWQLMRFSQIIYGNTATGNYSSDIFHPLPKDISPDDALLISEFEKFIPFAYMFIQEIEQNNFIDWNTLPGDIELLQNAHISILSLQQNPSKKIDLSSITQLLDQLRILLISVLRPWKYQNDVAREKLLNNFIMRTGVKLS
ncbi:hypothetical protein JS532_09990 [Bifidobacterium callimiconis]|uniref:hypothetical protein n=1 Tax=Bifidobacterium callimiconis TaxID=2306973 RepID=UPI001BDBFB6D|nr:hypothetical protein [Bifidobacterium callimiconis]MBT1177881.1 hypothetical protein [Bifidobacterium callimiconis]